MKLSTAFSYRMKYQMKSLAFFFSYFTFFAILFPIIGILFAGTDTTVNSDAMFASSIFIFIIAYIGVSSDFKLFIQNGMSRSNIFLSYLISNVTISAFLASVLIVFKLIANDFFTQKLNITLFFADAYAQDNHWKSLLFLFLFFLFSASLASVVGTFIDRVTGFKRLVVIATVIIVPFVIGLLLQMGGPNFRSSVFSFLKKILGISATGLDILPVAITLLVLITLFSIITYLLNYNREIRRIND